MIKRKLLLNWMYVEPLLRSMSAATESQDRDTQPSVAAIPSPARFTRPISSVKAEPLPETVTKKAKPAPPPPPKKLALAVKGSPAKAPVSPMISTPPAKSSMGALTPTPPKQMTPPPVPSKREVVTQVTPTKSPAMIARLREVPIPKPSAKVEKPVLEKGAAQPVVDGFVGPELPRVAVKLPPPAKTNDDVPIILVDDDVSPASTVKDTDTIQEDLLREVEKSFEMVSTPNPPKEPIQTAKAKAPATPPALPVTAKAAGGQPVDSPVESTTEGTPVMTDGSDEFEKQRRLEESIRTQLSKLDDVEFDRRVETAKKHALMGKYVKEHLELDDNEPFEFGETDAMEELICFEFFLANQPEKKDPPVASLTQKAASPVAEVPAPKAVLSKAPVPAKAVPPPPVPPKAVESPPKKVAFTPLPPKAPALAKNGTAPTANVYNPEMDIQVNGMVPRLD